MIGIALDLGRALAAIELLDGDEHTTGIGTIVRTRRVDLALHGWF
jgi:hypothetical protein